jgi:hypothetical protein
MALVKWCIFSRVFSRVFRRLAFHKQTNSYIYGPDEMLRFQPRIHLSREDYAAMLDYAGMPDLVDGEIGLVEFEELMRSEVARYVQVVSP